MCEKTTTKMENVQEILSVFCLRLVVRDSSSACSSDDGGFVVLMDFQAQPCAGQRLAVSRCGIRNPERMKYVLLKMKNRIGVFATTVLLGLDLL